MGIDRKALAFLFTITLFVILISSVFAETLSYQGRAIPDGKSNSSIVAKGLIVNAQECMKVMEERGLKVSRVNESLQQALQLYFAQVSLSGAETNSDYKLVNASAVEVCDIEKQALKAQDEFLIFNQSYSNSLRQFDLSSMKVDYDALIKSFEDERFEDLIVLINKGYTSISKLESSQTSFKLFYATTTRTIKDFFVENWKTLLSAIVIITIFLFVFWKTIRKYLIKLKLKELEIKKRSINGLIKNMQYEYFKTKKMSETEYNVKLKTFSEMLRDIDRQIPELNESLAKVDKIDGDNEDRKVVRVRKVYGGKVFKRRKNK